MIKEIWTLQPFIKKLKKAGITSVKVFLERCEDPQKQEDLRQQLEINVAPEQWSGAVAVVRELFR